MKIARILITDKCTRNCKNCCNKYTEIMSSAKEVDDPAFFNEYDMLLLTGGEPLLAIDRAIEILTAVRSFQTVYFYSSIYTDDFEYLMERTDGFHYTIHSPVTHKDLQFFNVVQSLARQNKNKSFRLYIENTVSRSITINPSLWDRIEIKQYIEESECKLPENEELFFYKRDEWTK